MIRFFKKIVYGFIYLFILVAIVFNLTKTEEKKEPEKLILKPLEVLGSVKKLSLVSGKNIFFALVQNPNENHEAVKTPYRFLVFGKNNNLIEEITGNRNFNPLSKDYIYETNIKSLNSDIYKIELEFGEPGWTLFKDLRPELEIKNTKTELIGNSFKIVGEIHNMGPVIAENVRILGVLGDKNGIEIFASETFLSRVLDFEVGNFVISFPEDSSFISRVDPEKTRIFYSSN